MYINAPHSQIETMQRLLDKGIATRRGIMNAHKESPYEAARWNLPNSEICRNETILLPLFSSIGDNNIERIASALREILTNRSRIKEE